MFYSPINKVKKSLGRQFFMAVSAVIVIGFVALILLTYSTKRTNLKNLSSYYEMEITSALAKTLSGPVKWKKKEIIEQTYLSLIDNPSSSVSSLIVFSANGDILSTYDSTILSPYDLSNTFNELEFNDKTPLSHEENNHLVNITPITSKDGKNIYGYLSIASDLGPIDNIIKIITIQQTVILVSMMLIILGLLNIILKKTIIHPLNIITDSLRKISEGDTTATIPTRDKDDELGVMMETFNHLLSQIEARDDILMGANKQLRDEAARIALLQETTVSANEASTIEEALQSTIENICHYINWPIGHVFLYDEEAHALFSTDIWCIEEGEKFKQFRDNSNTMNFNDGEGIPGVILKEKKPLWIEDVNKYPPFLRTKTAHLTGITSGMGFPVFYKKKVWAVIEFFHNDIQNVDEVLIDLLENIGVQIGRVIERKEAEEALRIAKEDADYAKDQAEKANIAKSEFLSNMSHELRTPLHGILSYTSLGLKKTKEIDEKIHAYFETIKMSGERLLALLDNLLDLSKLESGNQDFFFEEAKLKDVVDIALRELRGVIDDNRLTVEIKGKKISTKARFDTKKITQVILNLMSNAIKFTPNGKKITITFEKTHLEDHYNKTKAIAISIQDEGVGIPDDELDSVFDKFIQSSKTKTGAGGTGLGLSICKEIIDGHHGEIWAENNPKGGAKFTFVIPIEKYICYSNKNI